MLKILMISDVFLPRINGVSTSILTFRKELQALGHEVLLLAPEYPADYPDDDLLWRIPSRYLPIDPEDRLMRYQSIIELYPRLCDWQPQLIHIHTPFVAHYAGIKLASLLDIPSVETYHTFFEEYLFHYVRFLPKVLLRWLARHYSRSQCREVDHLIVPSKAMLEALRAYHIHTPATVLPTGIDLDKFSGGEAQRFFQLQSIEPQRPTLVYVGRVAYEKNIDFLLHVVKQLKQQYADILLIVAGEGPAEKKLQHLGTQLGLEHNLHFLGYSENHQDLMDCYSAADVFVFASRTETQGLVILEAMALGVPVVALAIMGTKDILKPGQGALIAEDNVPSFAKQVHSLLQQPEQRRALGQSAKDYVQEWQAGVMAERMVQVYETLV